MNAKHLLLFFATLAGSTSWAGHETGHGGLAHMCRGEGKTRIEMLDLYRGRKEGVMIRRTNAPVEAQLDWVAARLGEYPNIGEGFQQYRNYSKAAVVNGITGRPLEKTPDAFPPEAEPGCEFAQIANFLPNGTLLVQPELYRAASNTDLAALFAHETLYAMARQYSHVTDSVDVQRLVAQLFAGVPDITVISTLVQKLFPSVPMPEYRSCDDNPIGVFIRGDSPVSIRATWKNRAQQVELSGNGGYFGITLESEKEVVPLFNTGVVPLFEENQHFQPAEPIGFPYANHELNGLKVHFMIDYEFREDERKHMGNMHNPQNPEIPVFVFELIQNNQVLTRWTTENCYGMGKDFYFDIAHRDLDIPLWVADWGLRIGN